MDPNQDNLTLEEKLAQKGNFNVEKTYKGTSFKRDHFQVSITPEVLKAKLSLKKTSLTVTCDPNKFTLTREARNVIYVNGDNIYTTGSRSGLYVTNKGTGATTLLEMPSKGFSNGLYVDSLDCFLLYTMGGKIFFFEPKLKELTETDLRCNSFNDDQCAIRVQEDIMMFATSPTCVSVFTKMNAISLSKEDQAFEMNKFKLADRIADYRILDSDHFLVVGNQGEVVIFDQTCTVLNEKTFKPEGSFLSFKGMELSQDMRWLFILYIDIAESKPVITMIELEEQTFAPTLRQTFYVPADF